MREGPPQKALTRRRFAGTERVSPLRTPVGRVAREVAAGRLLVIGGWSALCRTDEQIGATSGMPSAPIVSIFRIMPGQARNAACSAG